MATSSIALLARAGSRFLFPAECALCRKNLDLFEQVLCRSCIRNLALLDKPLCRTCGRPIPPFQKLQGKCRECQRTRQYVRTVTAAVPFDDIHRALIHEIKFRKKRWVVDAYFSIIKQTLKETDLKGLDVIVPIPVDGIRRRVREFNQAKDLAKIVARILKKPIVTNALRRRIGFHPQSTLKRKQRKTNILNQFYVRNCAKIKGKTILLIDDILTTGATVNECARVLINRGAKEVHAFVLARTI